MRPPLEELDPLGPGIWRATLGATPVVVKRGPQVTDEATGLRALAAAGGPPVPEILAEDVDLLVISFVAPGPPTPAAEARFGRDLAQLHRTHWPTPGGGSRWIGALEVDPSPAGAVDLPGFYRARLGELARRCGLEAEVAPVCARLPELLPPTPPMLLHGDLWWGNVLWGADGRGWLIDPSVHGGHPEEDLAMLGLFGPVPPRILAAYHEHNPPQPGAEDRRALFELLPLLVHTALFGGGYRRRAVEAARTYR